MKTKKKSSLPEGGKEGAAEQFSRNFIFARQAEQTLFLEKNVLHSNTSHPLSTGVTV